MKKVFTTVVRPTCGCELVSSRHFPPEAQGNFLVTNNIGFQGIKQHKVTHYCGAPIVHQMLINAPDELKRGIDHKVSGLVATWTW